MNATRKQTLRDYGWSALSVALGFSAFAVGMAGSFAVVGVFAIIPVAGAIAAATGGGSAAIAASVAIASVIFGMTVAGGTALGIKAFEAGDKVRIGRPLATSVCFISPLALGAFLLLGFNQSAQKKPATEIAPAASTTLQLKGNCQTAAVQNSSEGTKVILPANCALGR